MLAEAVAGFDLWGSLGSMAPVVAVIIALYLFVITPQRKEDREERERGRQEYRADLERLHNEHRVERAQWMVALDDFKHVLTKISNEVVMTRREVHDVSRANVTANDDDGN